MKTFRTALLALLLALYAAPLFAQVEIPTDELLGTWNYTLKKGFAADLALTFKGDNSFRQLTTVSASQIGGSVKISVEGTWVTAGDSITLTTDPESLDAKYKGSNAEIGQQIEQAIRATRGNTFQMMGSSQGSFVLRHVVLADDLLMFRQTLPDPATGALKEEQIVMKRQR